MKKQPVITTISVVLAIVSLLLSALPLQAHAQDFLNVSAVMVTPNDTSVRITWDTNVGTTGSIAIGTADAYSQTFSESIGMKTSHDMTLYGLTPKTLYHFSIGARSTSGTVNTFDRTFTTLDAGKDQTVPLISEVHIVYVTGKTMTLQWTTDEKSSSVVHIGTTVKYSWTVGGNGSTTQHQVTVTDLQPGTMYHIQAESTDADNNTAWYEDMMFRTNVTALEDTATSTIYDIRPTTPYDPQVFTDSVLVTWRTNKLASGVLHWGTTTGVDSSIQEAPMASMEHRIMVSGLKTAMKYYFRINSSDVLGKSISSDIFSVTTQPMTPISVVQPSTPIVKGISTLEYTQPSSVYRLENTDDYYAIMKGLKYRLPRGVDSLSLYNIAPAKVLTISARSLAAYPNVTLVKSPESARTFYLYYRAFSKIIKIHIPSASIFNTYAGNDWGKIISVPIDDLNSYVSAKAVRTTSSAAVYLLQYEERQWVMDPTLLLPARGIAAEDIVTINATHLTAIPEGDPIVD
jgi:hypothetical protein